MIGQDQTDGPERRAGASTLTVAIMQPYFIPYAGYFRLLAAADLFIVYDCVQFPRRGWLHRNQLATATGKTDWLTLPLEKAPRDAPIGDLRFRPDAADEMARQMRRFPALQSPIAAAQPLIERLARPEGSPVDHIVGLLHLACSIMGLPWRAARSSALGLPAELRGQERILAIAKAHGATRYVNAPGGRALYDRAAFAEAGIDLGFLTDYAGRYESIAQRLATEEGADVLGEIRAGAIVEP